LLRDIEAYSGVPFFSRVAARSEMTLVNDLASTE